MSNSQIKRDAAKAAKRFHSRWIQFLTAATPRTLRRVAHELAQLEAENAPYRDVKIFTVLRQELELTIQEVGSPNCTWTVQRSLRDLRGRTQRKPTQIHVNPNVQQKLKAKLCLIDEAKDR